MIELRPLGTDADAEAYLEVRNRIEPRDPVTTDGLAASRLRPRRLDLLALEEAVPVGMAFVGRGIEDPDSPHAFGKVGVLPERRRRGIGTELFDAISRHAASFGRSGLTTEIAEDDADSLDYLGKRDFVTVFRAQQVALDLETVDVHPVAPPGVELVPVVDPSLDRLVYEAALEIERDLPAVGLIVTPHFEEWRTRDLGPATVRSCSFAAMAGGVVIGYGVICNRDGHMAEHGLTGVRAPWRQRGVARAIKLAEIEAAKAEGIGELRTSNEVANEPIRRLNESLGYRPLVAWLVLQGPLLAR
jgi:mycothiol synthase